MQDTTLYLVGWTLLGSLGCWLTTFSLNRILKRSRDWCNAVGVTSWALMSSGILYAYYFFKNADMAAHHEANIGFFVVVVAVWLAFSLLGTIFGALIVTLSPTVERR
ncbi:hypothetical protein SAMN05428984_4274 [Sphingomonas sp. OK281]|nr:hypothetical protein SAMN05428984_4274 [Sphingomonas sp. OK281]